MQSIKNEGCAEVVVATVVDASAVDASRFLLLLLLDAIALCVVTALQIKQAATATKEQATSKKGKDPILLKGYVG
jgi:hypothetical protein